VTTPNTTPVDESLNPWVWGDELPVAGALFDVSSVAPAYGETVGHDLSTVAGLLKYTIDFVNGEEKRRKRPPPIPPPTEKRIVSITSIEERPLGRERLRNLFHAAKADTPAPGEPDLRKPSVEFLADIRQRARRILWQPRLERTSAGGAEWRHHAIIQDADAFYSFIATLLMSEENRREFGQCLHCGRFFIVQKREQHDGRPERLYCPGTDHRDQAHAKGAADRQRRVRARRRAVELLKGWRGAANVVDDVSKEHPDATAEQLAERARALIQVSRKQK